jgi:dienelactone hydrolase
MQTKSLLRGEATIKLEATLYKPKGAGPFPLVVYSHTSTGAGKIPASRTLRPEMLAAFLVDRGIAVLAPMRRGRGASEGSYDEPYHCNHGSHSSGLENAIEDTDAAIAYARTLPYLDTTRIILAGASRGGILSVIYAARRPDGVVAVVNFVGAWTSEPCSRGFHESVLEEAGKAARVPSFWLYAENDSLLSVEDAKRYASVYQRAGGKAQFSLYPSSGRDGHFFYMSGPAVYGADLEAFLQSVGIRMTRAN